MRAAVYTRQSQDRNGTGLAISRQLAECERLCELRGWEIVARKSDNDMSGYSAKPRPGYQDIIELMRNGQIDVVVVWAVDRLTRRLADLTDLIDLCEETGVRIAAVSGDIDLSTPSGKLIARILGSVAQGEVETKSARQKLANQQAAMAGRTRRGTPPPFGWQADRITLDEDEAAALRDACTALLAGGTVTGVCRDWERRGLRPHQAPFGPLRERAWNGASVRRILQNPRNAGIATYKGTEVGRGEWQPIVAEETYRAVCELLADAGRKPTQGVRTLLGGLARCRCGNHVTGARRSDGQECYRCNMATRGSRPGPHVFVRRDYVDAYVDAAVAAYLSRPDNAAMLMARSDSAASAEMTRLRDESAAIRAKLGRLGSLYVEGAISEQDMVSGRAAGEKRLAEIGEQLAAMGRSSALGPLAEAIASGRVLEAHKELSVDRRRAVIDVLFTVTLHPSRRGMRYFDTDSVSIKIRVD